MYSNAVIKTAFGAALRAARDAKGFSRAALAVRLNISPRTIQSWETGRTFIEELGLIPEIEAILGISLSRLIALSIAGRGDKAAEWIKTAARFDGAPAAGDAAGGEGARAIAFASSPAAVAAARPRPGPLPLHILPLANPPDPDADLRDHWMTAPLVTAHGILRGMAELAPQDVTGYIIAPASWTPRGGVMAACRMGDSALVPAIPLGAVVVLDMRPLPPEKAVDRLVALRLTQKGLRIRRLARDPAAGRFYGAPAVEHMRSRMPFRPDHGDEVIGRVAGVIAEIE